MKLQLLFDVIKSTTRKYIQCKLFQTHWSIKYDSGRPNDITGAGTCQDCGERFEELQWPRSKDIKVSHKELSNNRPTNIKPKTKLVFYTESCFTCFYHDNGYDKSSPQCSHPYLADLKSLTRENIIDYSTVPIDCPARATDCKWKNYSGIYFLN